MKITKRQLRRAIKEALDPAVQKELDDARKYRTKGEWRLRVKGGGPKGETHLIPGWMAGKEVEDFFGDYDEAKIFDNELSAEVDRDRIKKDPANATAGELEVEEAPSGEKTEETATNENFRPDGQIITERWQKLAGLLKD